ncbi:chitooligosaccharide deacetylase [Catellatospora methionotrophica]|uniref:Chitooligosaccharide deacetylase n=1 Tax=Catellatospora methionotrophica TaxID=121620 RepID=A0A8J3LH47_9ACTN|nr:polysaccharide deacetylase family protein [Catellatospora methionotrophica]GIG14395.1 chitooligosaccharide deacetylase [Catellatospora methionotrophica]
MASTPVRRAVAVFLLTALLAPAACKSAGPEPTFAGPDISPSPSASPSPGASPSPSVQPSPAAFKSLQWYLDKAPKFGPAPAPQRVKVPESASAMWLFKVPTTNKVAFITIDDGALSRKPEVIEFIRQAKIPVTMFLNSPAATKYTPYFKAIQEAGGMVENHTITHTSLKGKSYEFQKKEICGSADKLEDLFGRRPTLFRPPFGNKDANTLKAAHACGAQAAFFWTQTVDKGIVRYQTSKKVVLPGDVLLMHFRPALMDDLLGALNAIYKSGLTPALLEDYIG